MADSLDAQPNEHLPTGRGVAVLIPCYNEELTIEKVVREFRAALPEARVYVYDNASTDATAERARAAGAEVHFSPRRGKGNVVRQMLHEVEAGTYLLVDGDDTYPSTIAPELIAALETGEGEMVVGTRLERHEHSAFPTWHAFGNRMISWLISVLFSARVTDVLSGYRALSASLVRSIHLRSRGFDIETELTLQTLVRGHRIYETPIRYGSRPAGSESKLATWADGFRILRLMLLIFRDYKPLFFFSALSGLCFLLGLLAGWRPILDYVRTRFVAHVPLALLAAALEILAVVFLGIGLILDAITRFHLENQERMQEIQGRMDASGRRS